MIFALIKGWGLAFAKLPRGFHIGLAIGAAILLLFTLHKCAVSDAVKDDRAATEAQVTKKQLGAERAANESDAARQGEIRANDQSTREAIDEAVRKNPEITPAGPVSRAVSDKLRSRQAGDRAPAR